MLGDLQDLLGSEQLDHVAQRLRVGGIVVDRLRSALEQRAHRLNPRRHLGKTQRDRLMLDENASALYVILHVFGGSLEGMHADAEILRRLNDLARTEINAG